MNRKVLSVCCIVGGLMWVIIGSAGVLIWELRAPDTDPGLVKSMMLSIVCCVLIIALITAIAAMDEQPPPEDYTRSAPASPAVRHKVRRRRNGTYRACTLRRKKIDR